MKQPIMYLLLCLATGLFAADITALDGKVYKNAEIITATQAGLDILYTDDKGFQVLKSIEFANLPEELRRQYMKDPEQSVAFQQEVSQLTAKDLNGFIAAHQSEIIQSRKLHTEIDQRKARKLLTKVMFAHRLGGEFRVISSNAYGSIALAAKITEGEKPAIKSGLIFVHGLVEAPDFLCQGYLYPTGVKVNTVQCIGLPVYATTAENAAAILNLFLNIQAEYAINGENIRQQKNTVSKATRAASANGIEQLLFCPGTTFYPTEQYPEWYTDYCRRIYGAPTTATAVEKPKAPLKIIDPRSPEITPQSFSSRYRDPFHPYGCPGAYTGLFDSRVPQCGNSHP